ncbi:transcriptional regulator, MarR family [Pseudorhodobacter antarcticus]|jgi:predicted NBD/HSP70 family sugar kinase|uniref:Transcriptional regulator, MarR family n=1 Tax=Pseudorhodobacter antarcticus TaxID=1077947 RepID=A0A1H8NDC1_9RHOB|nr:ROK family transcriptional regulator [Pseudorhodobacter antarcticus]SEO27600.1 transcriptional regulator, MarR family [Pseudorhodobacter antarcticus]
MDGSKIRTLSGGANQSGLRDYNERLLLSMLQRNGPLPGSDLARMAGLSPQTVSVILRKLESDGLLARGALMRGKVGKPSVPMGLDPDGVFSFGLKLGRRSAELILMDFTGVIRAQRRITFFYPTPQNILTFLRDGLVALTEQMSVKDRARLCGIGIASPFELWNWHQLVGAPAATSQLWKELDLRAEIATFSDLPVFIVNDATAACRAEHVYGCGKEYRDYAYVFIAAFIGGGIVLNHSVFEGHQGNAGALGSLPSSGPSGESRQLIDIASLHVLEGRLVEAGLDPACLWQTPQDWSSVARYVEPWIGQAAQELAKASISICAVIDFETIMIDGAFPADVKRELVERTQRYLQTQDARGLVPPTIRAGEIGGKAREIGAACGPIFAQFLLNTNGGAF